MQASTARRVLSLSLRHAHNGATMQSSAILCHRDAVALYDKGQFRDAANRALSSLTYSVGAFHADYRAALEHFGITLTEARPV